MKVESVSSGEFVSGAGVMRLRRRPSVDALKKKADEIRARSHARISKIANQRLQLLVPWWHQKFPTRSLSIIFGNGGQVIRIDGRWYQCSFGASETFIEKRNNSSWQDPIPSSLFASIEQAINDVDAITNGHMDGVPSEFSIAPIKKRGAP